jgi:hypothetical protein
LSIFTRILVFLTMVSAVLLAALIVPFVTNIETYKQKYWEQKIETEVQRANAADRDAELSEMLRAANSEIGDLQKYIAHVEGLVKVKDSRIAGLVQTVNDWSAKHAAVEALVSTQAESIKANTGLIEAYRNEVLKRRETESVLKVRNIDLAEKLRVKTTEADTLMTQLALNKERVISLSNQIEEYEKSKGYQPTPDTVASIPNLPAKYPLQPIFGRITQVRKYNGFDYVQVNVGSQDKVEVGMRFMIHTDNVYHGDVIITKVDEDAAAGRISIKRSKVDISKGMEVRSGVPNQ